MTESPATTTCAPGGTPRPQAARTDNARQAINRRIVTLFDSWFALTTWPCDGCIQGGCRSDAPSIPHMVAHPLPGLAIGVSIYGHTCANVRHTAKGPRHCLTSIPFAITRLCAP